MANAISQYLQDLSRYVGSGWNRFWFTPSDPTPACLMRIVAGTAGLLYLLSHTMDLTVWFGRDGLLPLDLVERLSGAGYHVSYLPDDPTTLWGLHALGMLVLLAFTLGLFSRITNLLSVLVILSYVHRGPMITGEIEPVLTMMLLYLCVAPTGARMSLDAWLKQRASDGVAVPVTPSWAATLSLRLLQVHLSMFYLMMAFSKLAGDTWWAGEAVWWLISRTETRLVDLTFLYDKLLLVNLWTHAIVAFELCFGLLIWNRQFRPLLLAVSTLMWGSLALLTGLAGFSALMWAAGFCFLTPELLEQFRERRDKAPQPATA